jgi:hypothetical protein
LASKRVAEEGTWEKKAMAFKGWLLAEKKLSSYSATAATMAACSFFSYYRQTLQFRRSESTRIGERNRTTEDYRFSIEDFAKMFAVADLEEKYVLTAGKSFGLRAGDFLRMARGDLEAYIDREPPISIGEYKTQKESVRAFPFVDTDAQPVIKLMLEKMTREGKTKPNDRMLPYRNEIQLSRVLKRIIAKAGINVGSKEVRFHCLRKFLIDHISSYMSESKWKQIVGKAITEGAYVSPDSLREDYARAMPETTFGKRKEEDVQKVAKLEALKLFAKASGYTVEDIARIRMRKRKVNVDEEIEEIEKMLAEKEHKEDICTDGEHCK